MSSAAEIRAARRGPRTISVPISGTLTVIECQRPPLLTLVANGWMPWPALRRVQEVQAESTPAPDPATDNRPIATVLEKAQAFGAFLDEWVCAAAVAPVVVLTQVEVTDPAAVLWINDLEYEDKIAIFVATSIPTPSLVMEFRGQESSGDPPGPRGAAVRDAAVDALASVG